MNETDVLKAKIKIGCSNMGQKAGGVAIRDDFQSAGQFIESMNSQSLQSLKSSQKGNGIGNGIGKVLHIIQITISVLICSSSALVSILLTSDFFGSSLHLNVWISRIAAVFDDLPGSVISFISTYDSLGRLFALARYNSLPTSYVERTYPNLLNVLGVLNFMLAVCSPTSAAYVTYTTLIEEGLSLWIVYLATTTIYLARFMFSNFTLRRLSIIVVENVVLMREGESQVREERLMQDIVEAVEQADPKYFVKRVEA